MATERGQHEIKYNLVLSKVYESTEYNFQGMLSLLGGFPVHSLD